MEFIRRQIKTPKSLGEILKSVRVKKKISLEQAEEETKVRARYLEALENSQYDALPESVYTAGFLVKYVEFLNLNKEAMIKKFNQEYGHGRKNAKIMVERRLREPFFLITPKFITIAGIVLVLLGIFGYIAYSVHQFSSPPNLEISSPSADQVFKEDKVEIVGKTDEGSTLIINGQSVQIDDRGNFHQEVKLHQGLNSFEIRSINQLKKESVKMIKVLAELPETEILPAPMEPVKKETKATVPAVKGADSTKINNKTIKTN